MFQIYKASLATAIFIITVLMAGQASAQQRKPVRSHIEFIGYPGFPEGHSTWDDIGYSARFNKVVIGVTNHG